MHLLARLRPTRFLLGCAPPALLAAPWALHALARAHHVEVGARFALGAGLAVPLPGATVWLLASWLGLVAYLVPALVALAALRGRAWATRNAVTLAILLVSSGGLVTVLWSRYGF